MYRFLLLQLNFFYTFFPCERKERKNFPARIINSYVDVPSLFCLTNGDIFFKIGFFKAITAILFPV